MSQRGSSDMRKKKWIVRLGLFGYRARFVVETDRNLVYLLMALREALRCEVLRKHVLELRPEHLELPVSDPRVTDLALVLVESAVHELVHRLGQVVDHGVFGHEPKAF